MNPHTARGLTRTLLGLGLLTLTASALAATATTTTATSTTKLAPDTLRAQALPLVQSSTPTLRSQSDAARERFKSLPPPSKPQAAVVLPPAPAPVTISTLRSAK